MKLQTKIQNLTTPNCIYLNFGSKLLADILEYYCENTSNQVFTNIVCSYFLKQENISYKRLTQKYKGDRSLFQKFVVHFVKLKLWACF